MVKTLEDIPTMGEAIHGLKQLNNPVVNIILDRWNFIETSIYAGRQRAAYVGIFIELYTKLVKEKEGSNEQV